MGEQTSSGSTSATPRLTGLAAEPAPTASAESRRAWIIAGSLLIVATLVGAVTPTPGEASVALGWIGALLFASSMTVFAFGIRGAGSVVGGRPTGVVAMLVLATWPIIDRIVWTVTSTVVSPTNPIDPSAAMMGSLQTYGTIGLVVSIAAALGAVVSIARARVVPRPWHLAPTWALIAYIVPQLIIQLSVATDPQAGMAIALAIQPLAALVAIAAPLFLGVVAIVLAMRVPIDRTVPVYGAGVGGRE